MSAARTFGSHESRLISDEIIVNAKPYGEKKKKTRGKEINPNSRLNVDEVLIDTSSFLLSSIHGTVLT